MDINIRPNNIKRTTVFMIDAKFKKWFLFFGQILSLLALTYGIVTFVLFDWLVVLVLYFIGGCLGGSITYHRLLSHRSWNAPGWWTYVGSLCGALFLIGSPLAWSNNHIAHHRYVDTDKDPHSPKFLGVFKVQWMSMLYSTENFRYSVRNLSTFQKVIHNYYEVIHVLIFTSLMVIGGWYLTALVYLIPSAVIWNMMSLVNTLNHSKFGYKNHSNPDSSRNNLLTGYITFGEGWHNNHHARASSANFGRKYWEIDISYWIIKCLTKSK